MLLRVSPQSALITSLGSLFTSLGVGVGWEWVEHSDVNGDDVHLLVSHALVHRLHPAPTSEWHRERSSGTAVGEV
jgi:hypothetical protein